MLKPMTDQICMKIFQRENWSRSPYSLGTLTGTIATRTYFTVATCLIWYVTIVPCGIVATGGPDVIDP
jgi:hypothetical protein